MKKFIRNLEKEYLAIAFLVIGILLVLFPDPFTKIFPWVLGGALVLRGILVVILALHYKDQQHGPGRAILYCVLGMTIMIRGSEATGIIGVMWAVLSLVVVVEEIDEMWREKHCDFLSLISALISIVLAVMLMVDPFKHFVTHVRVLGLEIVFSCLARGVDIIKARIANKTTSS